jgi:hypothetical protein
MRELREKKRQSDLVFVDDFQCQNDLVFVDDFRCQNDVVFIDHFSERLSFSLIFIVSK